VHKNFWLFLSCYFADADRIFLGTDGHSVLKPTWFAVPVFFNGISKMTGAAHLPNDDLAIM